MTKVTIKANSMFSHGSLDAREGEQYQINKGDAVELEKIGLASIVPDEPTKDTTEGKQPGVSSTEVGAAGVEPQPGDVVIQSEAQDEAEEKQAAPLDNKMAPAPATKTTRKK